MGALFRLVLVVSTLGGVALSCDSQETGAASGGGGSGGATSTTSGSSTTVTSSTVTSTVVSSGMGGASGCSALLPADSPCNDCLENDCCDLIIECQADAVCAACLVDDSDVSACVNSAPWQGLYSCLNFCAAACSGPCNPVTNEPCSNTIGGHWGCHDLSLLGQGRSGFVCLAVGADGGDQCGACDAPSGAFCKGSMDCNSDGTCARYCCDDGDCGTGTCDKTYLGDPNVGLCVDETMASACDAPDVAPSMGACAMP